jgi:hypothetical protein
MQNLAFKNVRQNKPLAYKSTVINWAEYDYHRCIIVYEKNNI